MIVRPRRSRKLKRWRSMTIFGNNGVLVLAALLACWTGCFLQHVAAATNSADLAALNALKNVWNAQSAFSSWVGNDPCGSKWDGIVCELDKVTQLNLANQNLSGTIPAVIGEFENLVALELSLNPNLLGDLPAELGNLVNLKSLSIQQCSITGLIPPELSKLTKLEFLALNNNHMRGAIPRQIGRLKELYWFDISMNQIGSTLPVSSDNEDNVGLDNLTNVKHFHFNNNTLQGSIPPEVFSLPKLIHLLLDSNNFIGNIPNVTVTAPISIMRLDHNQLSGPIPDTWRQAVNLTEIHINNNMLEGAIPDLSLLINLKLLDTSDNPFSPQPIPGFLSSLKMTSLQTLIMVNSKLQGSIPSNIFSSTVIQKIDMSNNRLNGSLSFGEVGQFLEYVNLDGNNITGFLEPPKRGGNSVTIPALLLKGNPVCNNSFYNVEQFCVDDTGSSKFYPDPKEPFCGGQKCSGGKVLNGETCSCEDAMVCHMLLNAPPYQILSKKNMDDLRKELAGLFSEAKIVSEALPRVEGQVTLAKEQLWIQSASLTENSRIDFNVDIFPPGGRNWRREEVLYMSTFLRNNSVHLPPNQGPYSFLGYTAAIIESGSGTSLSTAALGGIVAGAAVVFLMVGLIAFYAVRQKKRADRAEGMTRPFASWGAGEGSDNGAAPQLKGARFFPVSELKKATNNFSENNEIGSGGYGKVYRAVLTSGDVVAVKRAQEGSMQGLQEFKNEIELLSRVHHRNLVGLVGFCYEQGEQMLVYEFMVNGTLRDHLTGKLGGGALTWQNRLNIALGSAKGLSYLHELANPPIIHRDIKATNILLDERLTAKVADFGLSKLAPGDHDGCKNHVSTQVKGTLGYLDPEYYMTQQLTEKSDVYSFGVVLLELLTARAPIEKGKYIVREVRTALDKGGIAALRPMLDRNIKDCPANELEDFLGLALQCVEEAAKNRPTMNEVVKDLERICGHSFTSSVVGAGGERPGKDPYNEENLSKETQFQYSGGYTVPTEVQPK